MIRIKLLFGIAIATYFSLFGQTTKDVLPVKTFELTFDNDLFPNGSDRDYTTGLICRLVTESIAWKIPGLLKFQNRFPEDNLPLGLYNSGKKEYNYSFQIFETGLAYYTPDSLRFTGLIKTQRPYSSLQYFKLGLKSISKVRDWELLNASHFREMNTSITIGLTGGSAAESLQRWMHEQLLKKPEIIPLGWPNQIGKTKNIPIINYSIEYQQLYENSLLQPLRCKGNFYERNRYNVFQWYNLIGGARLNIGTMLNDVSVFFQLNIININRQYEHYLDFFREGRADNPHGGVEPKYCKRKCKQVDKWEIKPNHYIFGYTDRVENEIKKWSGLTKDEFCKKVEEITKPMIEVLESETLSPEYYDSIALEVKQFKTAYQRVKKSNRFLNYYSDPNYKYFNQHSFKLFIRPTGKFVAHNGFLQGPLLYDNAEDHVIRYIQPWVFQCEFGLSWKIGGLEIEYSPYILRTKEYPKQFPKGEDQIIPLLPNDNRGLIIPSNVHYWSSVTIKLNPAMMYEAIKRNRLY